MLLRIGIAVAAVVASLLAARRVGATPIVGNGAETRDPGGPTIVLRDPGDPWQPPQTADPFLRLIREQEDAKRLPRNLLASVLFQESRYRPEIIDGSLASSAGAQGIAQIVPRWHPNVDPLDPQSAIPYAAGLLRQWRDQFGSWPEALASYNWGPGNVSRFGLDESRMPLETRNYLRDVLDRVGPDALA